MMTMMTSFCVCAATRQLIATLEIERAEQQPGVKTHTYSSKQHWRRDDEMTRFLRTFYSKFSYGRLLESRVTPSPTINAVFSAL